MNPGPQPAPRQALSPGTAWPLTKHLFEPRSGDLANGLELVLSTGYRVEIATGHENPMEGFERLGNAILGEVFLRAMEGKSDFREAFHAVNEEITTLVDNLDFSGVRTALQAAIFAQFLKAYNDVEKGAQQSGRTKRAAPSPLRKSK